MLVMMTHEDGEAELGPGETSGLFQFLSILCFSVQARTEARRTRLCDVVRLVAGAAWPGLAWLSTPEDNLLYSSP